MLPEQAAEGVLIGLVGFESAEVAGLVELDSHIMIHRGDDTLGLDEEGLLLPEDGTFFAAVGDLTQRGGPDYYYRLALSRPVPGVTALAEPHVFKVRAGESAEIKVNVRFSHGFAIPLTLHARSLPEGVSAAAATVPPKGGDVVLALKAEAGALAASRPIQFVLQPETGLPEYVVVHRLISTSENNGVPQGFKKLLVPETNDVWLTVSPPKDAAPPLPSPP